MVDKMPACNAYTSLEDTFPNCLHKRSDGTVFRACNKCGGELDPRNGKWEAKKPSLSKDLVGWRISQLNSLFVDPAKILDLYKHPPGGRLQSSITLN